MYCADNGRPNRAVQTVLGVHLLKEMFNLTDDEALEQLEFNLLWHHALRLDMEETHLPQKTLHNFRVRLMQHDGGRLAFQETTERIIQALGIRTGKQRLDSTHIMSNIATLTRLGLFCETMRLFLRAVSQEHPELRRVVPEGLVRRYLKEEAEATDYEDARSGEGRRRLGVCARDLYRLVDGFRGTLAPNWRSTGCWRGCCGSSVRWATRGTGAPERAMTTQGKGRCPSPSGTRRRCGPIPCNRPTTRRPPTAGTKARGTRYRWRRPAMRRTPPS